MQTNKVYLNFNDVKPFNWISKIMGLSVSPQIVGIYLTPNFIFFNSRFIETRWLGITLEELV